MATDLKDRTKAIDMTISQIEKQFGKGSIMKMGEIPQLEVPVIPTGSLSLYWALGVGGIPRGRVIEIYGPESSGKSTLAQHIVAEAQKQGGTAAYVDAEHALDVKYASQLGVDVENLLVSQPDSGEQALDITEMLVRSGAIDVIVIDSVAALVPRAEIEGEMGDNQVGLQARLMSKALRKLTAVLNKSHTCAVFINQIREKVGVLFGNPETTSGGRALKFYSTIRLDIRRTSTIKEKGEATGNRVKVKVVKNKLAPPFREAEFDITFGEGISRTGEALDLGAAHDIVDKSGAWYMYNGEKLGQGRENAKKTLADNPVLFEEICQKIRGVIGIHEETDANAEPEYDVAEESPEPKTSKKSKEKE